MSASHMEVCPRCVHQARAARTQALAAAADAYGTVPPAEYERMVASAPAADPEAYRTFAEYYEVYGADTGTVTVDYFAQCDKCGFEFGFRDTKPVPGLEVPG